MEQPNDQPPSDGSWRSRLDLPAARRALEAIETGESEIDPSEGDDLPRIPGYLIECEIGAGGGGRVFRGVRSGSDRPVAIKVMNAQLGSSPAAQRVWRELDLLEQLRLPSVPHLLDYGTSDGRVYFVTDFIDGRSIVEDCRALGLDREARVALLARVADIVQTLHEKGVIHRDLKPGNILVDAQGEPVVLDFGVATMLSDDVEQTLTVEGRPIGSPAYMSPEQARGERDVVSTRSDVYSLGATAYVVLTGQPPHDMDATLHQAIRRVAMDEPRSPHELDATLPKPLGAVLAKAVARDPEHRYASPAAFADDLRRWLNREPVEASQLGAWQRLARVIGRHPLLTTSAASVLILGTSIILSYIAVWYLNSQPHALRTDPRPAAYGRTWVRLTSRSGSAIHEWNTDARHRVTIAELIRRPASQDGGDVVILGFHRYPNEQRLDGALCIVDAHDTDRLLWTSGTSDEFAMPEALSYVRADSRSYRIHNALLDDIFPEIDGLEIVAVHTHTLHSPCVIRVYDLRGSVLYEVWHDGRIYDIHWLAGSGRLVAAAISSEALWTERGVDGLTLNPNPRVLFAIQPRLGSINRAWIQTNGGGGTYAPNWYKGFGPFDIAEPLVFAKNDPIQTPHGDDDPSNTFRVSLTDSHTGEAVFFVVDDSGSIRYKEATTAYRINPTTPDESELDLVELPPVNRDAVRRRIENPR